MKTKLRVLVLLIGLLSLSGCASSMAFKGSGASTATTNVVPGPIRLAKPLYTRASAGVCTLLGGLSPTLRGTRGPVVYNNRKKAQTLVCSLDIGPALVPVDKLSHVLLRAADNSVSWEVLGRLCYHDVQKDRTACGQDASTQATTGGMYHYQSIVLKTPAGDWPVGGTSAWIEVDIVEVPPDGTLKGGIHSFTVYGY